MQDFSHHNNKRGKRRPALSSFDPQRIAQPVLDELFFGGGRYTMSLETRARALACADSWTVYLYAQGLAAIVHARAVIAKPTRYSIQADTVIELTGAAETVLTSIGWDTSLRHIPLTDSLRKAFFADLEAYASGIRRTLPAPPRHQDRSLGS